MRLLTKFYLQPNRGEKVIAIARRIYCRLRTFCIMDPPFIGGVRSRAFLWPIHRLIPFISVRLAREGNTISYNIGRLYSYVYKYIIFKVGINIFLYSQPLS